MKYFHRNDINAFLKKVPKEQKQQLLKFLLTHAKSKAKTTIQTHLDKKTFPSNKKVGGDLYDTFKWGLNKLTGKTKWRTVNTLKNLAMQHFKGNKNKHFGTNAQRNNKGLNDSDKFYARLSSEAYKPKNKRVAINGYTQDIQQSTNDHAVYVSPDKSKVVLVARGTNPSNVKDLRADASISTGFFKNDKRFKTFSTLYDNVKKKYGKSSISTTGHSLGGTQALYLSKLKNIQATSFNAGVSTTGGFKKMIENPKARQIIQSGDAISVAALNYDIKNGILLGSPKVNPFKNHSMSNFLQQGNGKP